MKGSGAKHVYKRMEGTACGEFVVAIEDLEHRFLIVYPVSRFTEDIS
jgi:hypothetical protein